MASTRELPGLIGAIAVTVPLANGPTQVEASHPRWGCEEWPIPWGHSCRSSPLAMVEHALLPAVTRILQRVEAVSGLPVAVAQEPGLSTLATLKPANKERQAHLILFRQDDEACSYHVAFEAALLLRLVEVPQELRVNLTEKREAREQVVAQVEKLHKGKLPLARARELGLGFYNGLMVQLRSIGPGLCADRWLFEEAPELRGLQAAVLQEQVQQNVPSLNADIDRLAPAAVVKASRGMNAAYAFQAAELVGLPPLAVPYQAAGFEALARELIASTREQATTADPDREMIDAWAAKLGIARWYNWQPAYPAGVC